MEIGYFFCADILGFSSIVNSLNQQELDEKIQDWTRLVTECCQDSNITKFQLLSDTIFAATPNDISGLKSLIHFARSLLDKGIKLSLPLRGAISHGEYHWGQLVYGRAVIQAHKLEMIQNWIGISLDAGCAKQIMDDDYVDFGVVCYMVPLTNPNHLQGFTVISWNIPPSNELTRLLTSGGLGGKPGIGMSLNWDWGNKVANTIIFRLYLSTLSELNWKPSQYRGHHPVHFLEHRFFSDT